MELIKGDIIKFDSRGLYPDCDNRYYRIIGQYHTHKEIKNIQEIDISTKKDLPIDHTQVIVEFTDGPNPYLEKMGG